jgi:uncharacterized protein (TIGR00156 family)
MLRSLLSPRAVRIAGFLVLAALLLPVETQAQDTAAPADSTVAQVLEDPVDDQRVTLRGVLLEKLSTEKYTFSDETGQIRVEIENDEFPDIEVHPETRIEISGELETAFMRQPEIDVEQLIILLKPSDPSSSDPLSHDS